MYAISSSLGVMLLLLSIYNQASVSGAFVYWE
nr:MAG TPA: hypothetical protein [Bacteriophage sp.]DAQ35541.1 MAG TPA: hypothetical protein [Caudoviricetes sp.]